MAFPITTLDTEFVAQQRYADTVVHTISIEDRVDMRLLRALVQLGEDSVFRYWVTVMEGDAYTVDWTNDDVTNAIKAFFANRAAQ